MQHGKCRVTASLPRRYLSNPIILLVFIYQLDCVVNSTVFHFCKDLEKNLSLVFMYYE